MGGFNKSDSESESQSTNRSFVFPNQVGPLTSLYNNASNVANSQSGIGNAASNAAAPLIGRGNEFLDSLGNVTDGGGGAFATQLGGNNFNTGDSDFIANLMQIGDPSNDPFLQGQIDALGGDISEMVARLQPGVNEEFIGSGTGGGSRNQIANALTNEAGIDAFARGAGDLRNASLNRSLSANQAGATAELSATDINNRALSSAGNIANASGATTVAAAQTGLNSLDQILGLNLAPYGAQFSPLLNLATILGNPAILSEGQSTGSSESSSFGFNAAVRGP